MKKFALIGGIGPASTVKYYQQIIDTYRQRLEKDEYPDITIRSINMTEMLHFVFEGDLDGLTDFLLGHIYALENAGFESAALASNTPHIVFDKLADQTNLNLISIVEETCKKIKTDGLSQVALFGTRSTMTAGFYQSTARKYGIDIFIPDEKEIDYIHDRYFNELVFNNIQSSTKANLLDIARSSLNLKGIEGLVLGGTELSLILKQSDFPEFRVYDTTSIHVQSIVSEIMR